MLKSWLGSSVFTSRRGGNRMRGIRRAKKGGLLLRRIVRRRIVRIRH
jgi:hypothetical protein